MADTVGMQDIRGLDIEKTVKGFALLEYIFKKDCLVSSMSGDSVRWYQETSADLSPVTPQTMLISPEANFPHLEVSWTRNTSYVDKYAAESFVNMEDMKSADIDIMARTLLRLTRAVVKQVDSVIYNALSESDTPTNIQTFETTTVGGDQWDATSYAGNPIKDILHAKYLLDSYGYDSNKAVMYLHPLDARNLMDWIIGKGNNIPNFASDKVESGVLMKFLGITIKVSVNKTEDSAIMFIPQTSVTWKSFQDTTSAIIEDKGIGSKIRVWELGVPLLTDPNSVVYISDLQT